MGEIRHFTDEHVAAVADLTLKAIRGRKHSSGPALQDGFREIFLENPWVTPEIPSLVYLEQGKVVGFLGVVPRTMEFRGRLIRVAITSQFAVDREVHRGNAALELIRHCFQGGQDLSLTDGSGDGASMVWTAAGGRSARLYSLNWTRLLRPLATACSLLSSARLKGAARRIFSPGDFLISKLPLGVLRVPRSVYSAKQVSQRELFDCIQEIGWREPLKPVYAEPSFDWLIAQAARASILGTLRTLVVLDQRGARVGWVVYYVKPGGAGYVLQIGVRRRDHFSPVLQALFRDAWDAGCCAVKGQAIPQFLTQLTEQHCVFRHPNPSVNVHSRDADLVNVIQFGDAAITRLDGECWMPLNSQT